MSPFEQGWRAYINKYHYNNYPEGSPEHYDWDQGWSAAWDYCNKMSEAHE